MPIPKALQKKLSRLHDRITAISDEIEQELANVFDDAIEKARDRYDNLSEKAQESERGVRLSEEADEIESAKTTLDDAMNSLQCAADEIASHFEAE